MNHIPAPQLSLSTEAIAAFCQRWDVAEFALFGSVLRDDFGLDSDVDVLLTFHEGSRLTLSRWMAIEEELEALFGRKVDVLTRKSIEDSPNYIRRKSILQSARVIYAQ
jgi:predicted nucleotidyltransferase